MTTTNGGPAQVGSTPGAGQEQPQLTVVGQYIKDFSFENPNAPQSLNARQVISGRNNRRSEFRSMWARRLCQKLTSRL